MEEGEAMSETKHTPGPWVADDNEGFSMWKIYSRMSPSGSGVQGSRVADVIGDSAEADANAALIAAAPELLEALRLLLAECEHQAWIGNMPDDRVEFGIARAAIAKAKGEGV